MAKFFSSVKTRTNGYTFADLASYLSKLEGADKMLNTQDYKEMIRSAAYLFADKTKPCYLDLTSLINKKGDNWNTRLYTAKEFLNVINKDMFMFIKERAQHNDVER